MKNKIVPLVLLALGFFIFSALSFFPTIDYSHLVLWGIAGILVSFATLIEFIQTKKKR